MLTTVNNKKILSDGVYGYGKKFAQVYIPAVSSLYFGLGHIWGLPAIEQVVGTLALVATFIGVVLGISSSNYDASGAAYDGHMVITQTGDKTTHSLELNGDPADLQNKDSVNFKVVPATSTLEPTVMPTPPSAPASPQPPS